MDDKQLKEFLKKDSSIPARSVNEWDEIQKRIKGKTHFFPLVLASAFSLLVIIGIYSTNLKTEKTLEGPKIAKYLMEDPLFNYDEDNLYAWID